MFSCKGRIAGFCLHYRRNNFFRRWSLTLRVVWNQARNLSFWRVKGEAQNIYAKYLNVLTLDKTEKKELNWDVVEYINFLKISKDLSGRFSVNVC